MNPSVPPLTGRLASLTSTALARLRQRLYPGALSGSGWTAAALQRCGIRQVYTVAGTPVDAVLAECAARGIRVLGMRHQQTAVLAAAAGNYVAGRLESVVVVSAGPAVTNTLTGLLVARDNGWPVVVLGGRRALSGAGTGQFQELDARPITGSLTRWTATPQRCEDIPKTVIEACSRAMDGRPGPVYLDLAEDVLTATAACAMPEVPSPPHPAAPEESLLDAACRRIRESRRPLLVVGDGLRWSLDASDVREFVEANGIPFISTSLARGYLPDDHPLAAGAARRWIQGEADVVLLAGASLDWRFRFGSGVAAGACVIHADLDGPAIGLNVPATIGWVGQPGVFLRSLTRALAADGASRSPHPHSGWHEAIRQARDRTETSEASRQSTPMAPRELVLALRDALPPGVFLVAEGNVCLGAAQRLFKIREPLTWLDPGMNGIIGGGIPFAIGAQVASPGRRVVALCGDTGFAMSAMDLESAVRHRLPVVIVVANNDGNTGALRDDALFPPDHPERVTRYVPGLRYEQLVALFGGHAEFVTEPRQFRPAMQRALESGRPACIHVPVDPHAAPTASW
ncbi:MAG: thiamine pyrophosphate-binding protein [Verrucomicrobiae bacterium]|nr:thiamine pyrophosphate-binding protein [Verrucomicrobiae bacterium]